MVWENWDTVSRRLRPLSARNLRVCVYECLCVGVCVCVSVYVRVRASVGRLSAILSFAR